MKPTVCTPAAGEILDVVGIGIGPFNLSLTALLAEAGYDRTVFLERKPRFSWHPGMLLEGTTLQVPFLADLVSLVAPTSRFSFLNYLQVHDRLYKFLFLKTFISRGGSTSTIASGSAINCLACGSAARSCASMWWTVAIA